MDLASFIDGNQSRVYFDWNESFGAAIRIDIILDGRVIGKTAANTYLAVDVPPGTHHLRCSGESDSVLDFGAKAGEAVYVWQEMKMGLMSARCSLSKVDRETGRAAVNTCKRAVATY